MDSRLKIILQGEPEEELMLLVRLKKAGVPAPFCRVIVQYGDIITCRVKRKYLMDLYNSPDVFSVKAPRIIPATWEAEEQGGALTAEDAIPSRRFNVPYTGKGVHIAAVDWGFDIAHANLRNRDGTTRFGYLWDQKGEYDGNVYGYGCIYTKEQINNALLSDTPYHALGYHPGKSDIAGTGMHGTHVVDIAAGTPSVGEGGVAPDAMLIGVELGNNFVNGSDLALGDSVRLIEALHFIDNAARGTPCVINMSLGSHGDSHTGRSLVELAFDNFLSLSKGFALVQSVGNYYSSNCHMEYRIKQGETYNIEWNIPRNGLLPNEAEIWYQGADLLTIKLVAPDGEIAAEVHGFEDIQIKYHDTAVGYIFHRMHEPNTGLNHIDIILDTLVLKGKWIIEVTGSEIADGTFHAYSERNDAGQARFSPHQSSPVTTTGSVCNSRHTITAGAYDHRSSHKPVVRFSSAGPTIFGQAKPDLLAPGYKIAAAKSAAWNNTAAINGLTVKSGSSMAAPHTAGTIALIFQKHLPELLGIDETKGILHNLLDPVPASFSAADKIRAGDGFLNINKLNEEINTQNMDTTLFRRPVRRQHSDEQEAEVIVTGTEQEYHAPYFHQNCVHCQQALLDRIYDGGWMSDQDLLDTLNNSYFNAQDLLPFSVYRHFHPRYQFSHSPFANIFKPAILPGRRLTNNISTGDIVLLRNTFSDKTVQAIVIDPELKTLDALRDVLVNSQRPGYYIHVFGKLFNDINQRGYVRIGDNRNRALDNVVVLKKGGAGEDFGESQTATTGLATGGALQTDNPNTRARWFFSTRLPADRREAVNYYAIASSRVRELASDGAGRELIAMADSFIGETGPGRPGTNNWTPLGPSVIANGQASGRTSPTGPGPAVSGRITSIAVNDQNRIYVGTANGGVWYSGDGGLNWEPHHGFDVSPSLTTGNNADSLAIGAVAVKFGASKINDEVYAGTGEANSGTSYLGLGSSYFGIGIRHRVGTNWTLEATNLAGHAIYKIVIDPTDSSRVFAATTIGLFKRNVVTTGGRQTVSWDLVTVAASATGPVTDFIIAGTGTNKKHYAAFQNDKVYVADQNLSGWTGIGGTTSSRRIALASGNSNPGIVYAFDQNNILYKLTAPGVTPIRFIQVTGTIPSVFNGANGGQGSYDIILAVDPNNDNRIYLGGDYILVTAPDVFDLSLYTGTIGGTTSAPVFSGSTFIGQSIHPDGHAMAFSRNGSALNAWVGCDGGVFHSASPTSNGSYFPRNTSISSGQVTYIAQREDTDAYILAGLQDNGTITYNGDQVWRENPRGDGGGVAIDPDPSHPFNAMAQYIRSWLYRTTDNGNTWAPRILPVVWGSAEDSNSPFYGPIATFHNAGTTIAAFGTDRLWITTDWGVNWRSLPNNVPGDRATTIVASKIASSTRIFAATARGVDRYDLVGSSWTKRAVVTSASLPAGALITALDVDNASAGSFYIALGGSGTFERCYYYDGSTLHRAGPATSLLNIPCHAIVVDRNTPNTVYLGSDVGVWKGVRGANAYTLTWSLYSLGLPEAAITDLKIHQGARLLRAGTHGRGVWEIALDATTGNETDIYLRANAADSGRMNTAGRRFPWVRTAEDPSLVPVTGVHHIVDLTMSPDIKVRKASLGAITIPVNYYDFAMGIGDVREGHNWQLGELTGAHQVFIRVHTRGLHIIPTNKVRVTLLMANATSGTTPDLPAGFTSHINSADTNPSWLGSNWKFADSTNPFITISETVNVRTPRIVKFNVRFSDLTGLTATSKVALLAFITTVDATGRDADRLTSTNIHINDLIMEDKHVAQRYVVFR